jgi:hypothetical protein
MRLMSQCNVNSPTHSPIHSLNSLTHSPTHSFTHSLNPLTHSFTHSLNPLTHSFTHSLNPLTHSFTHSLTHSLTHSAQALTQLTHSLNSLTCVCGALSFRGLPVLLLSGSTCRMECSSVCQTQAPLHHAPPCTAQLSHYQA